MSVYHRGHRRDEESRVSQNLLDYLDLVEVLSRLKGDHIVGGDASDRFICGVLCSVESQRRLTWNHLHNKHHLTHLKSQINPARFRTRIRTRTGLVYRNLT